MLPKAILLGLGILLLLTAISQGKQGAIYRSEIKTLQESSQKLTDDNKKLLEENKKQEEKIKKLEQDYQKLKISRSTSPNSQTSTQRVSITVEKQKILSIVYSIFWPDPRFDSLIMCESGYNNWAEGYDASHDQYNWGIFQVADSHGYTREQLANPTFNITIAKQIYIAQGWGAWPTCSRTASFA